MIFVFAAHRSQDIEHGADFPVEYHSFTPSAGLILHLYLKYKYKYKYKHKYKYIVYSI